MDYSGITRGSIRAEALKKLAELTVQNPSSNLKEVNTGIQKMIFQIIIGHSQITQLKGKLNGSVSNGGAGGSSGVRDRLSEVAIAKKEYEVIIALSDATKEPMKVDSQIQALINKFKAYLFELPDQKFAYSIVSNSATISPWNLLGEKLTTGLINLAMQNTKQYLDEVVDIFQEFIEKFFDNMNLHLTHFLTLAGVLDGFNQNAKF